MVFRAKRLMYSIHRPFLVLALASSACLAFGGSCVGGEGGCEDAFGCYADANVADSAFVDDSSDLDSVETDSAWPQYCPADGRPFPDCPCRYGVDEPCCLRSSEAWSCFDWSAYGGRQGVWGTISDCVCGDSRPECGNQGSDYPLCQVIWGEE